MNKTLLTTCLCALLGFGMPAVAHEPADQIFPEQERGVAQSLGVSGPKENKGIEAVTALGSVDLSNEFPQMDKRILRAREIIIQPGGVVAVHRHEQRPGLAYILEGEIYEHRNDHPEPLLRQTGAVSLENSGVVHWWENRSDTRVRALVVDIVPDEN